MEITKPNDILVATYNNPNATTYDFMSIGLTPDNTSLYKKDEYKDTDFVKNNFKTEKGDFDDVAFENYYKAAQSHYQLMGDETYIKGLDEIMYSPFDETRPTSAKTYKIDIEFAKDYNPYKQTYSRTGINSINESDLSLREIAQQGKIFDYNKNTWSNESVNDRGLLNKLFGETLVYAQYDSDGTHEDPETGKISKHKKGDWKVDNDGNLFVETLGKREIYGKQIVNPMDSLTTDGSFANKFDIFDSDSKETNALKTTIKLATEIAPLFIPVVNVYYGGVRAAIGLASTLPTFYKSLEGMLLGDNIGKTTDVATVAEGYLAKFATQSFSDEAQGSLFNYEQLATMTSQIFSQIFEQRAAASLSKLFYRPANIKQTAEQARLIEKINNDVLQNAIKNKFSIKEMQDLQRLAVSKVPGLQELSKAQSELSKALSLGYMAITTTSDIYGQALQGGYDRRTAGFAALATMAGQYGIMMNNRMGHWFLDKTTGYNEETNKALMGKAIGEYFKPVKEAMDTFKSSEVVGKAKLASIFGQIKNSINDLFTSPSIVGEALVKNAIIEGVEEVTEQAVMDATKGVVDVMSYLGLTKKQGTFGGFKNVFSQSGFENYLSNLLGGVLGGAMFEFHRIKVEPWLTGNALTYDTKGLVYDMISNGETNLLIDEINKQRSKLGNNYISPFTVDGEVVQAEKGKSHADVVADMAIHMIKNIEGLMQSENLIKTDDEIINKSIRDYIVIRDLQASKGENKIGIEGLIVDDFRKNAKKLTDVNSEIQKLQTDETNKTKNADAIKELKDEAKIYRDNLEKIKSGEKAGDYFKQMTFYLSKELSENFMIIDRVSYVNQVYGKSYYSLPDTGSGITKERVDKEWNQHLENTNVREKIEETYNAFQEMLKNMGNPTTKYVESGYVEERKKTLSSLLDIDFTTHLFDVSSPEKATNSIKRFFEITNAIDRETGKRIIPWDIINLDLFDKINKEGLLISSTNGLSLDDKYLNNEINIQDQQVKRGDIIKDLLLNSIKYIPSDTFLYPLVAEIFNDQISKYNKEIEEKISNITEQETEENKEESIKRKDDLENKKLFVNLQTFEQSKDYKKQEELLNPQLLQKQIEIGLYDTTKNDFSNDLNKDFGSYKQLLEEKSHELNKQVSDLSDEEILDSLKDFIKVYSIINPNDKSIVGLINSNADDKYSQLEPIVDSSIKEINDQTNKYKEYTDFVTTLYKEIKTPEFFNATNYTIKTIISEIKKSKNLDKEMFLKLEKSYSNIISSLKTDYFKNKSITNKEFLDLVKNIDVINNGIAKYTQNDDDEDVPDYLKRIIDNSEDPQQEALDLGDDISEIYNNINKISDVVKSLSELEEVLNNEKDFISNSIYDYLQEFELFLDDKKKLRKKSIFQMLKEQELNLFNTSEMSNYQQEGMAESDMTQAINTLKLLRTTVRALQTTEVTIDEPYGFLSTVQNFEKRNKLESDISKLKTLPSDIAELMIKDLGRIQNKLEFLIALSKNNSGKLFTEQEEIRTNTNKLLLNNWISLVKTKPNFPDISEIIGDPTFSNEKKLLEIETKIFEHFKDSSQEEKIKLINDLTVTFKFNNILEELYDKSGIDRITKEIKGISNNDFLLYIASSLVLDSKYFNNKLLNILQQESFDKSPFFTQELATKVIYASIINPELFAQIAKNTKYEFNNLTEYITYALGNAGTGKTTVIFKSIVSMLKDENPNLSIWFSGPHIDKAIDLYENVLSEINTNTFNDLQKLDKNNLFDKLGILPTIEKIRNNDSGIVEIIAPTENTPDQIRLNLEKEIFNIPNDLPDLIFIDEITHFEAWELEVLNEVVKRAKISGKNLSIITSGDNIQLGATSSLLKEISYNIDRVSGIFVPQLTLTIRSLNSQKRENSDYLYALVRKSISVFENDDDSPIILNYIDKGVLLKSYVSKDKLAGEIITSENKLSSDILNSLKNILIKDSSVIIGILSNTIDISPELKKQFDSVGITESNYKVYTPKTIQGSEADYFILSLSQLKSNHILTSLRKLYTYMTRSKQATIMLNDLEGKEIINDDGTSLKLIEDKQDYSTPIQALKKDIIEQNKKSRIEILKSLLNGYNGNNSFKIAQKKSDINDNTFDDNTFISQQPASTIEENKKVIEETEDNFKYRLHTFYNDINIKYTEEINNNIPRVRLQKNNLSNISYGLDFLFDENETEKVIDKSKFDEWFKDNIDLKYKVWNSYYEIKSEKFKTPKDNPILSKIFGLKYGTTNNPLQSELVIRKSKYDNDYNTPREKKGDNPDLHLTSGEDYLNLFLKVTSLSSNKKYYIHLGVLPKIKTVNDFNTTYMKGKFTNSAKQYEEFIKNGDEELVIKPEQLEMKTSTRLVTFDKNKPEYTLEQLSKFPGISFWNNGIFSKVPTIKLFPSNFDNFVELYRKIGFGEKLSEDKLKEMFYGREGVSGYKGKPYIAVSFVEDKSQVKFILLKSKTRSLKEITNIIRKPFSDSSSNARKSILERHSNILPLMESLFSGNQVLDMLIKMAIKQPDLFNKFFKDGNHILTETKRSLGHNPEFLNKYISSIENIFSDDLLAHLTYSTKTQDTYLRQIFSTIQSEISKSGPKLSEQELKKVLLEKIKGTRGWWNKFWNFFIFKNSVDELSINTDVEMLDDIRNLYKEYSFIMQKMIDFWDTEFNGKFYYNIPLETIKGSEGSKSSDNPFNENYLYTTLTPESPYLNIDLSKEVNFESTKIEQNSKENPEIIKLKNKLSKIKYNGETIYNSNNLDNALSLQEKITRANTIKQILEHKNNIYVKNDLIENNQLNEILVALNAQDNVSTIDSVSEQLNQLIINTNKSLKLDLINNFISTLNFIKSDEANNVDKSIIEELILKWNNKVFPDNKNLFEFLQTLPNSLDGIANTIQADPDEDYIGSDLTGYIYNKLEIDLTERTPIYTDDIFKLCNIK